MATAMYGGGGGFDNATQFGGGGFVNSSPAADGTGASPGDGTKRGVQTLVPLTIKQLATAVNNSADDNFMVDGHEIHNITLVGRIVQATNQSTSLQYMIDDGTGKCNVMYWIDGDESDAANQQTSEWQVGRYVRVFGHLRSFQGKLSVVAFTIQPIKDFNEVTFHLLECIFVHVQKSAGSAAPGQQAMGAPAPMAAAAPAAPAAAPQGGGLAEQVLALYNSPLGAGEQGISVADVARELGGRYTHQQVQDVVEKLVNDGNLYSTIDEVHFKSTG